MEYQNIFDHYLKFYKFTSKVLFKFLIFNLILFTPIILLSVWKKPYPIARGFLTSSMLVNSVYIMPSTFILGWENPTTWMFYPIRDGLYNAGINLLPKNEGEKEIWWRDIRWVEYAFGVENSICDWGLFGKKNHNGK